MRVFLWGLALVGLVLLAVVGLFVITFTGNPPLHDGEELGDVGMIVVDGYTSAAVLNAGGGQVALVDAGADVNGVALLAALKKQGLGPEAVKAIFLTHGHADHTAGVHLFPKAEVYALTDDIALTEGKAWSKGPLTRLFPHQQVSAKVTHPLRDGEVVPVGTLNVHVYAVPGHTPGSAAYEVRDVLFVGDSADVTKDGKLAPAKWAMSDDSTLNRKSLVALADKLVPQKTVELIVASHTGSVKGLGPLADLAGRLR